MVYNKWKNPPISLSLDIYLYNWTNPEDFGNDSIKPILQQCGPYRFTEKPDKVDINWHPENASVTYRRKSYYYFDAAGSNGSLDDEIVSLNAVALVSIRWRIIININDRHDLLIISILCSLLLLRPNTGMP